MLGEGRSDGIDEPRVLELAGREVHREGEVVVDASLQDPVPALGQHGAEDERADVVDEVGGLGDRDEHVGWHGTASRIGPSEEGLRSPDAAVSEVELGLVVHRQRMSGERVSEALADLEHLGGAPVQLVLERDRSALGLCLGLVHRGVRFADHVVGPGELAADCDATRRTDAHGAVADGERRGERLGRAGGEARGVVRGEVESTANSSWLRRATR